MNKLPIKIDPDFIAEAIIEIRFEPKIPSEAVFGFIYKGIKDEYPEFKKLDILQLPDFVRESDKNLHYMPHYSAEKDNYLLRVGPKVLSFLNINRYQGWITFFNEFKEIIKMISFKDFIEKHSRISIRYINVFEDITLLKNLKLLISFENNRFENDTLTLEKIDLEDEIEKRLKLGNNIKIKQGGNIIDGSAIDLDIIQNTDSLLENDRIFKILEKLHNIEKTLFFSLLKDEYIERLNPQYKE